MMSYISVDQKYVYRWASFPKLHTTFATTTLYCHRNLTFVWQIHNAVAHFFQVEKPLQENYSPAAD